MPYISLGEICSLPKAGPRKIKRSRKKGKTKILTCTPVRIEIAEEKEKRKKPPVSKVKKTLFNKKVQAVESSSSSEDELIQYDDDGLSDDDEIIEGDYVVVQVAGKSRVVPYIAWVDAILGDAYEGIFLQKVLGRSDGRVVFVPNEDDAASFAAEGILQKLPMPMPVGGSALLSNQLNFNCKLDKWNLR